MPNPQLLDYVKQQLAQGLNKETIQHNLLSQGGWTLSDVNEVFKTLGVSNTPIMPMSPSSIPVSPIVSIQTATQAPTQIKYAGFWIRYVANFIDGIILTPLYAIGGAILAFTGIITQDSIKTSLTPRIISFIVQILIVYIYFILMTYYKGATLGKMLVGIRVQSENNQNLSFGKVIVRETIGKFISVIIFGIGYLMAAFTKNKQALHDKIAHTIVVYKDPTNKNHTGLIIGVILAAILPAIAILGILSSVVLASLNVARTKGSDSVIKANISMIRPQAELYYMDNNNSYIGVCTAPASKYGLTDILNDIKTKTSVIPTCLVSEKAYVVSAPLKSDLKISYCVDSSGYVGNGIADKNLFNCNVAVSTKIISTSTVNVPAQNIIRSNYTYTLPAGWQSVPISLNHIEAVQDTNSRRSLLTIATTTFQTVLAKGISEQNLTKTNINDLLGTEFLNSTILDTQYGLLGGEKAFISKVNVKQIDSKGNTVQLFIMQYLTFYKGLSYIVVLTTSYPQDDAILSDFQSIANSFKFTTNSNITNTTKSIVNSNTVKTTQTTQPIQTAVVTQPVDPIIINIPHAGQNIPVNVAFPIEFSTPSNNTYHYSFFLIPGNLPSNLQQNGTYFDKIAGGYAIGGFHLNAPTKNFITEAMIPNDIVSGQYKLRIYQFDYQYSLGGTNTVSSALSFKDSNYFNVNN